MKLNLTQTGNPDRETEAARAAKTGQRLYGVQWQDGVRDANGNSGISRLWYVAADEEAAEMLAISVASPELDGIAFDLIDADGLALKSWPAAD